MADHAFRRGVRQADNDLTTLPAGVFDGLTALTTLWLLGNPVASFSPTADALPDNGTVPASGGKVTLDGSSSDGGPWGTNVTYSWSETSGPTSGVTFDDDTSATPVVTIPALTAGTVLTFTLTVAGRATDTSFGTAPDTDDATVTVDRTLTLTVSPSSVSEDAVATVVEVTGTLDGTPLTSAAQVAVTVGASDDTATEGTDYATVADFTLTIAAGEASGTTMFTLTPTDDAVDEVDEETLSVTGTTEASGVGDVVGTTVTITDDDESSFTVTAVPTSIAEDGGATTVTVSTGGVTFADDRQIALTLTGTATKGTDYTVDSETLTLTAGETSVATMVTAVQDAVDEEDETIDITAEGAQTRVTITDDDDPTAGICGRTAAVQTAILGKISGVTDCALVTDAHLAAITGDLGLSNKSITALAAGDFDGLTALETLYLYGNALTTLPAGVFDELTALKTLDLDFNGLTTLPDGVFDELTALDQLFLEDNGLDMLPAGVFDGLTALTKLTLLGNPGASFSPTADALPDNGTVPAAGGTVMLDGSSSDGGPWGTNVTYSWSQTSGPTSGVTFDDDTSATPVVTIPALTAGTELTFTLTVTGRATDPSLGTESDTDTATITAPDANAAPVFTSSATFSAAENQTAAGTVQATDSDADDNVTGYEIQGGADASKFSLDSGTGKLRFVAAPNYEAAADDDGNNEYMVVVRATSGAGAREKTADQTITVTVTDVDETGLALSTDSLGVSEGSSASYTVVLGSQPTAEVTVDITGHSGTDLTLDPASASLTFTTTNWATAQTVTVEADQDDDAVDDTATLVHTASGGGYDSVTGDLPVTVTEDDTAQVTGVMLTAGDARLEVEWTAVANATGYKVQWKSGGQDYDPATRQATVSSGSTTSHQIDSLANGTEYTVQVIAVRSGANDGPPSDEVMGTPKVPNTSAVGLPMITGTAEVGETLTANTSGITDVDGLINVSYRYRWIRVDGNDETDIADATDSTYVLVTDDAGTTLKVEVTFTDDADHEQTLVSAPTQVIQDLRPYVTLASPNAYHLETLGLHANEATGRPVTLVVLFSAEVTGLEAEEFVIENGEVTNVFWVDCLSNPSRVRWCIVMQPADAQDERMTLTIPENIADGGNQPAPEVYYAVLRGTAPTGTFTTAAVEPVSRDFLARLTFDQDMLEDAPGTETLVFPEGGISQVTGLPGSR